MHVEEIMEEPVEQAEEKMDIELTPYNSYINQALDSAKSSAKTLVPVFIGRVSNTFAFFITCPIYIFFMLLYANNLKSFYFAIFQGEKKQKATAVLKDINGAYANYIKGMAIVITIVSVLTGTGLAILGIDYAIFLGVFAGLMTLIPYIGVFVSAIIPIIIALITKDTFWYAGGVVLVFVIVQVLEGNVITPKIVGDKVGLNPLVVIIGIVIFGAIAGVAGMIITIPVLALFKIIAEHAPGWEPIKLLLKA
jgi:predicted PurR-regulated permease PerM